MKRDRRERKRGRGKVLVQEGRTPVANLCILCVVSKTLAVCTFAERAMAGAAVRRRQRILRSMWRGVQTDAAPTTFDEYVVPAAAPYAVTASRIPVIDYLTPAPPKPAQSALQ